MKEFLLDIGIRIVEHLGQIILVILLATLLPKKSTIEEIDFQEFIENPKKASKANWIFAIYIFLLLPIIAYPLSLLFERLNTIESSFSNNNSLVIYPSIWSFYIFSLLILYAFSCKPPVWFLQTLFKNQYNYYRQVIAYSEYSTKIDHKRLANSGFILLLAIAFFVLFLQVKSHAYFYPDKVEFFDFPTWKNVTYHYTDISKIVHTPGFFKETGGVDKNEHYRIYFKDNNHWSSLSWNDLNEDTINAVKLVSEKTKKIIEEIPGIKN